MTEDGYLQAVDGILNGNRGILSLLLWAVENYVFLSDTCKTLKNLSEIQKHMLDFAYENSNTYQNIWNLKRDYANTHLS